MQDKTITPFATDTTTTTPIIPIIYPYRKEKAKWDEIVYSVRSVQRYFVDPHQIYIVGPEDPELPGTQFIYYEDWDNLTTEENLGGKLELCCMAVEDGSFGPGVKGFVWINDDVYLLKPTRLFDIMNLSPICNMIDYKTRGNNRWQRLLWHSFDLLQHHGINPVFNFSTHTPYYYDASSLLKLSKSYPFFDGACLVGTIYHNIHRPCPPADVRYLSNMEKAGFYTPTQAKTIHQIKARISGCRYLNHDDDGLTPALKQVIMDIFKQ